MINYRLWCRLVQAEQHGLKMVSLQTDSTSTEEVSFNLQRELLLIVAPVVGGLLLVALISLLCLASMVKKKRSLHGTYSPQKQEIQAPRFELTEMVFKVPPQERLI